ncbi:MAG: FTR1 family protein [Candidatus Levyibacteriota bacterium]
MLSVFIIAFREFFEAFLLVGVLLSISRKFHLQKTGSILAGSVVGLLVVFVIATIVFSLDSNLAKYIPKDSADLIEGWLFTLSGIFIAYAVFSLHKILSFHEKENIKKVKKNVDQYKASYWLMPVTAFLFVFKEGCEGVLFNVSNGLFYTFTHDLIGFGLAFVAALICGFILQKFLMHFSIKRVFKITEVFIIFVGVDAISEGLEKLATFYFNFSIEPYAMVIALFYIIIIYQFFIKEPKISENTTLKKK